DAGQVVRAVRDWDPRRAGLSRDQFLELITGALDRPVRIRGAADSAGSTHRAGTVPADREPIEVWSDDGRFYDAFYPKEPPPAGD
ncbi:MAG: hypothetical protein ACLGI3_21310, partial [Actinomycetes bacterium]